MKSVTGQIWYNPEMSLFDDMYRHMHHIRRPAYENIKEPIELQLYNEIISHIQAHLYINHLFPIGSPL